ncbi:NUDIX pyrophosphatase [Roseovarius sp. EL26]|uniref:NUDIX hydrolase n=1 Tax=Roseovarius sp. EL26 TaxID=2126672 RepID=UPI000EA2E3B7|nr:NUDIX domain-containing protein [Roseovarius sp. EL26]
MSEIPIRSFMVSLIVLRKVETEAEVLLLKRTQTLTGEWCQVAGGIEGNETAWQAALRELMEETGLSALKLYSADICEQFYEADRDAITMAAVFVAIVGDNDVISLNHEHSDFQWVSFEQARDMVPFAGQRNVLRHVEEEIVNRPVHPQLLLFEG